MRVTKSEKLKNFLLKKLEENPRYLDHVRVKDIREMVGEDEGFDGTPSATVVINAIFMIIPKELLDSEDGFECNDGSTLIVCDEHGCSNYEGRLACIHRYALYNI